ncbi:MAG: hypothetical protein ACRC7V_07595 [Lachnospiraceae bacterium]
MFEIFFTHTVISILMILFFTASIILYFIVSSELTQLIHESDKMNNCNHKNLKNCISLYKEIYQENKGILNTSVFVDKFLNKISHFGIKITRWKHMSGQAMLLAVFMAGIGAARGIMIGETLGEILPFYIYSLLGLYIYFSVSGMVDYAGKKSILKTNIVYYLENELSLQLEKRETVNHEKVIKREKEPIKTIPRETYDEKELEELLKEFLT